MKIRMWVVFVALFLSAISMLACVSSRLSAHAMGGGETWEKYGRNIFYFNFSEIPESVIEDEFLELPKDLREFISTKYNLPRTKNKEKFFVDFWEEAEKLGYSEESFRNMGPKEAIMAAVKIVTARFSYFLVDTDKKFINQYGAHLPIEEYFHLKLGDCDKYRDATIVAFGIIKNLNPNLKNVYLTREELGGRGIVTMHAWVAVLIPTKNYLMLSHVDPTFYDSGGSLEAGNFHISLKHDIFQSYFYFSLPGRINILHSYGILFEAYSKIIDDPEREELLCRMGDVVHILSIYDAEAAASKIPFVLQEYEQKKFKKNQDTLWYNAYKVFSASKNDPEKERYKQKLLKHYPDSYWTKLIEKN